MKMFNTILGAVVGNPITGDQGIPIPLIICLVIAAVAIVAVILIPKIKK
jgi:hypothetical protein